MIFDTRSHQQNGDDPSTIRAPIRLHPSPDTRPSRPLNSTNTSGNVWYEEAREYGLHRCLPAHILLVRLCHHHRDGSGASEVKNTTIHNKNIAAFVRLVSTSNFRGGSEVWFGCKNNHILAFYFVWYNNQPRLAESQAECGLLTTQVLKYSTDVLISTFDSFGWFVGRVYMTI